MSSGDLSIRMDHQGNGSEFDQVKGAVNSLAEGQSAVIRRVAESSQTLREQSGSLSQTLDLQVQSGEQTESEASNVASSVEEISLTAKHMAESTEETTQLTQDAQSAAETGGQTITEALSTLERLSGMFSDLDAQLEGLNQSSSRVDGVTDMINGLAEQTNLLALNAAIEAARAGDAGRGFSVVADEVRALAEKTVAATSNINQIVGEMQNQLRQTLTAMEAGQKQVASSRELGDSAINAMADIRNLFGQVSDRNLQQAESVDQIAATTQDIANSMQSVVQSVAQGAEGVREVKRFSSEVVGHADTLLSDTSQFRT
ncbi:MAG: methyl-accepting chemotaxis protein [Pontibacterium sp.]